MFFFFFFFFQAEDGIRDGHVTGVQTCALPICSASFGCVCALRDAGTKNKETEAKDATIFFTLANASAATRAVANFFMPLGIYPRTRTALKLSTTCPPAVGRPKLSIGLKREKSSICSK